jgi:hypothetical protein
MSEWYSQHTKRDLVDLAEKLQARIKIVLNRETATIAQYDAKLAAAEAKLAKAVEALQFWSEAVEPDIDKAIALMASTIAELKGEQP